MQERLSRSISRNWHKCYIAHVLFSIRGLQLLARKTKIPFAILMLIAVTLTPVLAVDSGECEVLPLCSSIWTHNFNFDEAKASKDDSLRSQCLECSLEPISSYPLDKCDVSVSPIFAQNYHPYVGSLFYITPVACGKNLPYFIRDADYNSLNTNQPSGRWSQGNSLFDKAVAFFWNFVQYVTQTSNDLIADASDVTFDPAIEGTDVSYITSTTVAPTTSSGYRYLGNCRTYFNTYVQLDVDVTGNYVFEDSTGADCPAGWEALTGLGYPKPFVPTDAKNPDARVVYGTLCGRLSLGSDEPFKCYEGTESCAIKSQECAIETQKNQPLGKCIENSKRCIAGSPSKFEICQNGLWETGECVDTSICDVTDGQCRYPLKTDGTISETTNCTTSADCPANSCYFDDSLNTNYKKNNICNSLTHECEMFLETCAYNCYENVTSNDVSCVYDKNEPNISVPEGATLGIPSNITFWLNGLPETNTATPCAVNDMLCWGNNLYSCNPNLYYEKISECGSSGCNETLGACNPRTCYNGQTRCIENGNYSIQQTCEMNSWSRIAIYCQNKRTYDKWCTSDLTTCQPAPECDYSGSVRCGSRSDGTANIPYRCVSGQWEAIQGGEDTLGCLYGCDLGKCRLPTTLGTLIYDIGDMFIDQIAPSFLSWILILCMIVIITTMLVSVFKWWDA